MQRIQSRTYATLQRAEAFLRLHSIPKTAHDATSKTIVQDDSPAKETLTMNADADNFWQTEEGLLERIGLLGDQIQLGTYNHAVQIAATAVGATDFTISGDLTTTSCAWCQMHVGQTYHRGQFTPILPKHCNCTHYYEVERIGAAPSSEEAFASFWGLLE